MLSLGLATADPMPCSDGQAQATCGAALAAALQRWLTGDGALEPAPGASQHRRSPRRLQQMREDGRKPGCSAPAQGALAEGRCRGELGSARLCPVARGFEQTPCAARMGSSQTCTASDSVLR